MLQLHISFSANAVSPSTCSVFPVAHITLGMFSVIHCLSCKCLRDNTRYYGLIAETYLGSFQISMMKLFLWKQLKPLDGLRNLSIWIFLIIHTLTSSLLQLEVILHIFHILFIFLFELFKVYWDLSGF